MSFYQPRFFLVAIFIHIVLILALKFAMVRPIIPPIEVKEITAELIAPPQVVHVASVEPPKPKPVQVKKEIQKPLPKPAPLPVIPRPTTPSEHAIEIPTQETPKQEAEPVIATKDVPVEEPKSQPQTAMSLGKQEFDEPPRLKSPGPAYPRMSRKMNETGTVLIEVLITAEGKVKDFKLKNSSGFKGLDDVVLTAAPSWRFEPAKKNGKPVDSLYTIPFVFSLKS